MTNVLGVDPTSQTWQQDTPRQPAKDFAHELAKHDEEAKADQRGAADGRGIESDDAPPTATSKSLTASLSSASETIVSAHEAQFQAQLRQLAQATTNPTGMMESLLGARVFGWHAMAQVYLSELAVADHGESHASADSPSQASTTTSAEQSEAAPAVNDTALMATAETVAAASVPEAMVQAPSRSASQPSGATNVAETVAADGAASSYWSERSLRFTRQRDGSAVAWLRDFRVSDSEASHLIQFVLNDAKAKGMVLSKVMLNGREAWASPTSH